MALGGPGIGPGGMGGGGSDESEYTDPGFGRSLGSLKRLKTVSKRRMAEDLARPEPKGTADDNATERYCTM